MKEKTFIEMVKENARYPSPAHDMCEQVRIKWKKWKKQNGIID